MMTLTEMSKKNVGQKKSFVKLVEEILLIFYCLNLYKNVFDFKGKTIEIFK